ncbi:hypothetical protein [Mucilaginibacter gilvus]|uniref:Uncharacterized protein n=1 Tax=Mucilaginibacter gilvus TaxID=2305909 RepID=A0A3S3UWY9_9SPHI|nr:hypothetical protein [Mucilaginibacter gilvus]RWY50159.1 hypothetical protein EPL05_15515 [Mucilaginibacter gilvus]
MAKYLQVSFYTWRGIIKVIDLGDFSYGEWIVYNDSAPRYIVDVHTENESDRIINSMINKGIETFDSIISKINIKQGNKLHLANMPLFRFVKKEEYVELDLPPLPVGWLKNL